MSRDISLFVQLDLPIILSGCISLIFTVGFIRYILQRFNGNQLQQAKYSIATTVAFLSCYVVFFIALIFILHPSVSYYQNVHCVAFLFLRSFGVNTTQYFSQLFYILRIKTILSKLLNSACSRVFPIVLIIFLHIVLFVNFFFTFFILTNQYPNMIMDNVCVVMSSSGIRPLMNGVYQLLILFTFIFITSNILCSRSNVLKCSSRLTRTIIAGIFISSRIFFFPLHGIMSDTYKLWFISLSDILACIAVLSDYYKYNISVTTHSSKRKPKPASVQVAVANKEEQHTATSLVINTASSVASTEDQSGLAALDDALIDAVDNGFTGKHVPPMMAKALHKFWTEQYLTLSDETRDSLDQKIHHKLRDAVQLPDRYRDKHFRYLSHLGKLMLNLLRVDVLLETKLSKSWGTLHSVLEITPEHCDLALGAMNEVLLGQFGVLYGVDMEYLFSRIYRTAVSLMLDYHVQNVWFDRLIQLEDEDKQIISKSLKDCVEHDIGRDIIWVYLQTKAPHIYLFHELFVKYNQSNVNEKRLLVCEIQRICMMQNGLFVISVEQHSREQFDEAMNSIQLCVSDESWNHMDQILIEIHNAQMGIVQKSYWKTFSIFIF